jgi:hypothetical protein
MAKLLKSKDYMPQVDANGDVLSIGQVVKLPDSSTALTATATLTAAQVLKGYIKVTSATAVTLTMPTGTLLGAAVDAAKGTSLDLVIDNTASTSSGVVTIAAGTNGVDSAWDVQLRTATASVTPAAVEPLTVALGVTGIAVYRITFSSATAYVFSRIA